MTPFEIDILLHYYVSPDRHRVEIDNPPIWRETRQWFLDNDLLRHREPTIKSDASYEVTERGKAWIEHVCSLPLPVATWVMPKEQA